MTASIALALVALAAAPAGSTTYKLDPGQGGVTVHVKKAGLFAPALHDHQLVPTRLHGEATFDPAKPTEVKARVVLDAASFVDREPGLSAEDRAKVEDQVRSEDVLDAKRFPRLSFSVTGIRGAPRDGSLVGSCEGVLTARGKQLPLSVPVVLTWDGSALVVKGTLQLKQSELGITPLRKGGGTIRVKDELEIDLELRFVQGG